MAEQSKVAVVTLKDAIINLLAGSRKKQVVSATILLIIGFLLHIRNKKSYTETLKLKIDKKNVNYLNYTGK